MSGVNVLRPRISSDDKTFSILSTSFALIMSSILVCPNKKEVVMINNPRSRKFFTLIDLFFVRTSTICNWQLTRAPCPLRSEEHTSELQSRFDLVCRLLLEKKNKKYNIKY